jgi:uncharacterized DUF497 family protein
VDKTHIQNGITFVWDQHKAATNIAKHDGISFEQATQAFFDPFLRVVEASQNNETRDAIIGMDKQWSFICRASFNRIKRLESKHIIN